MSVQEIIQNVKKEFCYEPFRFYKRPCLQRAASQ